MSKLMRFFAKVFTISVLIISLLTEDVYASTKITVNEQAFRDADSGTYVITADFGQGDGNSEIPLVLPSAAKYVPYSYSFGTAAVVTSGNLPAGLTISQEGILSGRPTELGVFSFTVTDGGGTQYACTLSVLWHGGVDVEQYNEPGYGFVETATDDGRLHDLYITDRSELKPQTMHLEGSYSEFYALYIDGNLLTRGVDYTAEEGSTHIILNAQAQENARGGTHLIDVEFHSETTGTHHTVQTVKFSGPALPGSEVTVRVQGIPVIWTDGEPIINADSRTMVPLRAIADAMGLEVDWNANMREATFSGGGKAIIFPLDNPAARTIEGGTVSMDTAATAQNGRTFAPVRYLAEYFGYNVDWEGFSRTVDIQKCKKESGWESDIFANLPDFVFSSGVGGWGTFLTINSDGTFTGKYRDSDMGVVGPGYSQGTVHICDFSGRFSELKFIGEYTLSMRVAELNAKIEEGKTWIENEVRYIASSPYGMDDAYEVLIYLPGAKLGELPEEFVRWISMSIGWSIRDIPETLPFYGLYNVGGKQGFYGIKL